MRYLFEAVLTTAVALALTGLVWAMAHIEVARECEKLGAFYFGDKVFECKRKEGNSHDN
jgi:hypothetical protein